MFQAHGVTWRLAIINVKYRCSTKPSTPVFRYNFDGASSTLSSLPLGCILQGHVRRKSGTNDRYFVPSEHRSGTDTTPSTTPCQEDVIQARTYVRRGRLFFYQSPQQS